jgi:hypothetical protein
MNPKETLIMLCKAFADGDESVRDPLHDLALELGMNSRMVESHFGPFDIMKITSTTGCSCGRRDEGFGNNPYCILVRIILNEMEPGDENFESINFWWSEIKNKYFSQLCSLQEIVAKIG